jgi:DNA-binding NarL/FixJ family response regulator
MCPDASKRSRTTQSIRILVAENTLMSAQLLADALGRFRRLEVAGFVCNSAATLKEVTVAHPHVAVIGATLDNEPLGGLAVSTQLRSSHPDIRSVMLLDGSQRDVVIEAFRAGARGVFCRDQPIKVLCKCIQSVCEGQVWANSTELGFVLEALHTAPSRLVNRNFGTLLSKREQAVVACVAEGLSNREAAARLKLSEHTIKNYLYRVFNRLGVSSRVELILYTLNQGAYTQASIICHGEDVHDSAGGGTPPMAFAN